MCFSSNLVCCTNFKDNTKTSNCSRRHIFCNDCIPDGCNLCLFLKIQAVNDKFDSIPSRLKKAFYHCSQWQSKVEENPILFTSPKPQSLKIKTEKPSGLFFI